MGRSLGREPGRERVAAAWSLYSAGWGGQLLGRAYVTCAPPALATLSARRAQSIALNIFHRLHRPRIAQLGKQMTCTMTYKYAMAVSFTRPHQLLLQAPDTVVTGPTYAWLPVVAP
jgi:hypothetical protein